MSQNGPYPAKPWPGGTPDEHYSEASDPWHGQDPSWIPQQPPQPQQYASPAAPSATPRRSRGFPAGALVILLSVLAGGGAATAAWFAFAGDEKSPPPATIAATTPAVHAPRPQTSADARFAASGQCVRNEGTNAEPELRIVACTANTYQILKRIDGRTTGEKDAVSKCAKVPKYTKWYYYDTEYDDVDFVLCLREYEPV